jgi:hypothetical protein
MKNLQDFFNQDFDELIEADEDELQFIEQCHFGDMLIEQVEPAEGERYKLWKVLDCNGGGIQVEYCGHANGYIWETVF